VPVVLRFLLCRPEKVRVEQVDLQGGTPVLDITSQEGLEFLSVLRVPQNGRVEGHGVAGAIWEEVQILAPISLAIIDLSPQGLSHGVYVSSRPFDVCSVRRADGIRQKLSLGPSVRTGGKDESIAHPIVPAQHPRPELAVCRFGLVLPGLLTPEVHHHPGHLVRLVIVPAVLGRLELGLGLQGFMTCPVRLECCHQLLHGTRLLVEDQVLDGEK